MMLNGDCRSGMCLKRQRITFTSYLDTCVCMCVQRCVLIGVLVVVRLLLLLLLLQHTKVFCQQLHLRIMTLQSERHKQQFHSLPTGFFLWPLMYVLYPSYWIRIIVALEVCLHQFCSAALNLPSSEWTCISCANGLSHFKRGIRMPVNWDYRSWVHKRRNGEEQK